MLLSETEEKLSVLNKMIEFNHTYNYLFTIDALIAVPTAISAFLLAVGSLSLFGGVVIGAGLYFGKEKCFNRSFCKEELIKKFNELKDMYDLYCKNNDAIITHNEVFLKLLKAILPFTTDVTQLVPKKWLENPGDISAEFRKIFAAPPHYFVFPAFPKAEPSFLAKAYRFTAGFFVNPRNGQAIILKDSSSEINALSHTIWKLNHYIHL